MRTLLLLLLATPAMSADIVYCGTDWCSACREMKPVIEKLEAKYDVYHAKKIEFPKYRVTQIPTTIVYRNGYEVKRFVGYVDAATIEAHKLTIRVFGFSDHRFSIRVIGRILKRKHDITLIHELDNEKYNVKGDAIIFYENGKEVYRCCSF